MATAKRAPSEPRHFMRMAIALTAIALFGFGLESTRDRTDYSALHWTVFIHAAIALGWCALAIIQPWLIEQRNRALHRKLGWLGAALAVALAYTGMKVTLDGIAAGRLEPGIFLVLNGASVLIFLALVGSAIRVRRHTDWHRRLLTSATILITAPAWPRILPMEALGPFGILAITGAVVGLAAWGAVWDRRVHGRVHPAWWWGMAAVSLPGLLAPLAFVPAIADWAATFAPG